ncbi:MAG: glycosyltransferase [Acetobacter sp.]|nr:glycosyltransferase [Bacteroides sp.]MCM1341131.1 glycosyltransferase [Acetobacter sp.]MCM1433535.1 glycosyltransferase [Clostridiales bacterium]
MKILVVNPIIYTSETKNIKRVNTIKDTMIYDLCLGFTELGAEVTLAAAEDYKPSEEEDYPFKIIWLKTKLKKLFPVNTLPYCPGVISLAKHGGYDFIITSEVFSLNSLMLTMCSNKNLIVWHELAKHNKIFKGIASKIWYGFVARLFFRNSLIVPRSIEARDFIGQFCHKISDEIIDHGVNLHKFTPCEKKKNYFVVSSQLIKRKRIDKILCAFSEYLNEYDSSAKLYIMGDGDEKANLEALSKTLNIEQSTIFTGKLNHDKLIDYLRKASAMLVYTEKDNNMVSIVESISVGTPVITTSVPYNAGYIKANNLGIVNDEWSKKDLHKIIENNVYIKNCLKYRETLSTTEKAETFIKIYKAMN